jgi:GDP-4-dehydro-6-deoxy-D-mannose reductase
VARVADERPDAVYHLAARGHVGDSWGAGDALTRVNVGGTRAVVDACVRAGVGHVLVVGSAEQYGAVHDDELPVRGSTALCPLPPCGWTTVGGEQVAVEANPSTGSASCARAFSHTGPGQPSAFLIPGLAARIAASEREGADQIVLGNGEPVRDFSDVRDVVRAYALLVERGTPGEAYNVCSGRGVRVGDLAAELVARATRPLRLVTDGALVRPVDVPVMVGDPTKLTAATGWSPALDLARTLDDVLAAARATAG